MPYLNRDDLEALVPPQTIIEALDDDGDGVEDPDLFDKLAAAIDTQIDGRLSRRYTLPLAEVPASLRAGAAALAAETLYQRRGIASEQNPHHKAANEFRGYLDALASGDASLVIGTGSTRPPISIISEKSRTKPSGTLNG